MTTNNSVNVGLSGSTGTGNFVGSNAPTIVAPIISSITNTGTLTLPTATGTVFASGSINKNTSQPYLQIYISNNVTTTTGNGAHYSFLSANTTTQINQGFTFSAGAITIPTTGKYLLTISVNMTSIPDGCNSMFITFEKSGAAYYLAAFNLYAVSIDGYFIQQYSIVADFTAGDIWTPYIQGSNGSDDSIQLNGSSPYSGQNGLTMALLPN